MKKMFKSLVVLLVGVFLGYYMCFSNKLSGLFNVKYKAFQVGVYTTLEAANTYRTRYKDSIVIKDNELYRVYVSILKDSNNIEYMKEYLDSNNISYYLKDIEIENREIKKEISEYENIMNNNEVVFLEINKMIIPNIDKQGYRWYNYSIENKKRK
jgi:hypothetical protein